MFKVNDFVVIVVDHPLGSTEDVFGQVGMVTDISGDCYEVTHSPNPYNNYLYAEDELRTATDEEIRLKLQNLLS